MNWVRSKIGFERLEPRIIYRLEHKDAKKESAHGEPVATEQGVSGQPVEAHAQDKPEDVQKAPEAPASEEPIVAEVPVDVPSGDLTDAPTEPVTGGATEPSAAVAVSGADDPTEAFTRIPHDAASEEPGAEKPKN